MTSLGSGELRVSGPHQSEIVSTRLILSAMQTAGHIYIEQSTTMPTDSLAWNQNAIEGLECQRASKKNLKFFFHQTCTGHRHRHHPPSHSATTMKCIVDHFSKYKFIHLKNCPASPSASCSSSCNNLTVNPTPPGLTTAPAVAQAGRTFVQQC